MILPGPYPMPAITTQPTTPQRTRATSTFKVGSCCICERTFRPKRVRMETLIYCSRKCCSYTSIDSPRKPMGVDAAHDAIIHREWDAIQWAQDEAKKFDNEPLAERILA